MALFDDLFSGGNWMTSLALGVGAVVILPLAAPILRPVAKTAIKGGILAYQGLAGLLEGVGDLVAKAVAETGRETSPPAPQGAAQTTRRAQPRRSGGPVKKQLTAPTKFHGGGGKPAKAQSQAEARAEALIWRVGQLQRAGG
jgi:hypothetical protein